MHLQMGHTQQASEGVLCRYNDQVMYLRSDGTAIAMGEVQTAAARPSDDLSNPASPSNFLQIYQADTQSGAVNSGSGSKQLPKYVYSKSCQQIRALYIAMQVRNVCTIFVAESQSSRPAVLGSQTCPYMHAAAF